MASPPLIRYLPDTNILVHYARGSALARAVEAKYSLRNSPTSPIISIVTVGEVRAFAMGWGDAKKRALQRILDECVIVPLDLAGIVDAYADLKTYNHSIGRTMGDNDIWIAATAKVTGALLLTTDKDFDHLHPTHIQRDWIDPHTK